MNRARARTSPQVKWLANELAAVAGELERIEEELLRLNARKARLTRVRAALSNVSSQMDLPHLPESVPTVRPHSNYGGRGALRDFLRAVLRSAHPRAVDTITLTELAGRHFGREFANAQERSQFRKMAIAKALQAMVRQADVERLHDPGVPDNTVGVWRWKVDAPALDDLRLLSAAVRDEPNQQGAQLWP